MNSKYEIANIDVNYWQLHLFLQILKSKKNYVRHKK
jgi:hypothetical protein